MNEAGNKIYEGFSDADLLRLIRSGDHAAYTQVFERYWAVLLQHAVKMLRDQDKGLDVVQDVFAGLWEKRAERDINTSVKSYLYTAVRNRVISHIRHTRVEDGYLDALAHLSDQGTLVTDHELRFRELSRQLEKEVALLPPRQREVFELSRKQGLSHAEIAALLEISDETVKKQIYKALKTLKVKLDAYLLTLML
ncbi:RNA polymerase sigma factor [Chitinophaga sp. 22620]|uniref:RNA polymerase sigma factor n=1 Tax=Chitinophaga sp. 22620 TaxID=3453952 RepID=UPI003F86648E